MRLRAGVQGSKTAFVVVPAESTVGALWQVPLPFPPAVGRYRGPPPAQLRPPPLTELFTPDSRLPVAGPGAGHVV